MTETRILVQCDGAVIPQALGKQIWSHQLPINSFGTSVDLNLRAQNLWGTVINGIESHAADLVRIASYVYAADQVVSRGGMADVYGQNWRRNFMLCTPVSDPSYWEQEHVRSALTTVLLFVTEDHWEFHFAEAPTETRQLPLDVSDREILGTPDTVALFSGGADSLCTAIEAVVDHKWRPILVSHRPAPHLNARQSRLASLLRDRFVDWDFPHLSFWIHRRGSDAADSSQRSRAFLFACIGTAVAAELGISRVLLGDNGIVSLNLPFSAQFVGALASRSTHPKFIHLFNEFIAHLIPEPIELSNPLWTRTRAEVLEILTKADCADLLQETNSCSRTRGRPDVTPHCGYCSQCVDRRFGSVAAGLEDSDLRERYETDIFVDPLPEGEARTVAESYVRFARQVQDTNGEELFDLFPQLFDCIIPTDDAPDRVASELVGLLHRHAASVLDVTSRMVARNSGDLANGALPESCLLRLVVGSSVPMPPQSLVEENVFRQDGQRWTVMFGGHTRNFNHTKGMLYLARLLAHPRQEFHSLDLAQDLPPVHGPAGRTQLARLLPADPSGEGMSIAGLYGQDILDDRARMEYRERIQFLRQQHEAQLTSGDERCIAEIDYEIDQIERALRSATGLGGRPRTFDSAAEGARKAVSNNLHRSLKTVGDFHPQLHRHLKTCVNIGAYCSYNPDPSTTWNIR